MVAWLDGDYNIDMLIAVQLKRHFPTQSPRARIAESTSTRE